MSVTEYKIIVNHSNPDQTVHLHGINIRVARKGTSFEFKDFASWIRRLDDTECEKAIDSINEEIPNPAP